MSGIVELVVLWNGNVVQWVIVNIEAFIVDSKDIQWQFCHIVVVVNIQFFKPKKARFSMKKFLWLAK